MSGLRVLVVDDDVAILRAVRRGLEAHGYRVDVLQSGAEVLTEFRRSRPDVILLDLLLPDADGVDICRAIRAEANVPVIVLSAVGDDRRKVQALDEGADDYLVKPFAFSALLARVRTLLRRGRAREVDTLTLADLELDILKRRAARAGKRIDLTAKEFALLELFLRRPGEVLSRIFIDSQVWDMNFDSDTNVVEVASRRLRAKVDDDFTPRLIHTLRGMGYVMEIR